MTETKVEQEYETTEEAGGPANYNQDTEPNEKELAELSNIETILEEKDTYASDDAVKMYLKEIGKVTLLNKEAEFELSRKMGEGCLRSKNILAVSNLRLVCYKYYIL